MSLPYSLPFRQCLSLLHLLLRVLLQHALAYVALSPLPPAALQGYVLRRVVLLRSDYSVCPLPAPLSLQHRQRSSLLRWLDGHCSTITPPREHTPCRP